VVPLDDVVDRHEPIEERILFVAIRLSGAPIAEPRGTAVRGIGAGDEADAVGEPAAGRSNAVLFHTPFRCNPKARGSS
jgi:hypothetical protein